MLTIRMHRIGKTNQPSFKIVVVDKRRSAAAGRFCEEVGKINRVTRSVSLNKDRIKYWMSKGAQASPTINNLLISEKIIEGKKTAVHAKPKKKEEKKVAAKPAAQSDPAAEAAPVQSSAAAQETETAQPAAPAEPAPAAESAADLPAAAAEIAAQQPAGTAQIIPAEAK